MDGAPEFSLDAEDAGRVELDLDQLGLGVIPRGAAVSLVVTSREGTPDVDG